MPFDSSTSPSQRSARARAAALTRWAHTDTVAGTAAARRAFLDTFERRVDPDGVLPPAERAVRAARLRTAHFTALAMRSAAVRRHGKQAS